MATFTHAIYIDESGNGSNEPGINRYWITTAVAVDFEQKAAMDTGIKDIISSHFRPGETELKGTNIPHRLKPSVNTTVVAQDVANLMDKLGVHAWIAGTNYGTNPPPGFMPTGLMAKEIARQFVFERLNGFLLSGYCAPGHFLVVWDISNQQELNDFSASVARFRNAYTKAPLSPRLAPAVLGGLSHDWSGLQIADILSHYALHHVARKGIYANYAREDKASDFELYFKPKLQKDSTGNQVGWKIW